MRFLRAFFFDSPTTLLPFSFSVVNRFISPSQLALAQVSTMLTLFVPAFTPPVDSFPKVGAGIDGIPGAGGGGVKSVSKAHVSAPFAPAADEFGIDGKSAGRAEPRWSPPSAVEP